MDDDPAGEDVDFEVELEVIDVVSCAFAVVSLGFNALVFNSILAAMAPVLRIAWALVFYNPSLPRF